VESSAELFADLNVQELHGDETMLPLVLAEELASVPCADEARHVLESYRKLSRASAMLYNTHSPSTYAYQRLVEAAVLEAAGERRTALRRYREAFDIFVRIGYRRRAIVAALRLSRLAQDAKSTSYANVQTRHLSPRSWMRVEAKKLKAGTLRLTTVQREVLGLICQGKSNPDIARLRKRSLHTIRNLIARLFVIFAVSSREELAVECVRRGLYTPQ
jgi:DNA-binding CsgD family transcriptional regulator